jgi:hypothetical protein
MYYQFTIFCDYRQQKYNNSFYLDVSIYEG